MKPTTPMKAIRLKCLDCCAGQLLVEVGAGTDIDVLSEQISEIVEIRQRLGRINRYANKFKFWDEPKGDK